MISNKINDVQFDLSIYKAPYFRMNFDLESEQKQIYVLQVNEIVKLCRVSYLIILFVYINLHITVHHV